MLLKALPFWTQLTPAQQKTAQERAVTVHFAQGAFINGGDTCLGLICVMKGSLRAYLLSEEGREITLFRVEEGDVCVLSATCVISQISFETQLVAEAESELLLLPSAVFNRLAEENIYVKCFAYELLTERFSAVMQTMEQMLFDKFDKRLATFLLAEYRKTGAPEIRMTHEQLAVEVNSAREVVARMMKQFAEKGYVENQRGRVRLKDIAALQHIAEE